MITRTRKRSNRIHTGGSGVAPVRTVYCLKISRGVGPSKKNPSKIPDSNIQCVVTSGTSLSLEPDLLENNEVNVERKP